MAQLIPLPLTVSCFSKIQIGFLPFWYRLTRVVPDKGPLNGCVCVRICVKMYSQYSRMGREMRVMFYSGRMLPRELTRRTTRGYYTQPAITACTIYKPWRLIPGNWQPITAGCRCRCRLGSTFLRFSTFTAAANRARPGRVYDIMCVGCIHGSRQQQLPVIFTRPTASIFPWASAHRGRWGQLTPLEKWMKN